MKENASTDAFERRKFPFFVNGKQARMTLCFLLYFFFLLCKSYSKCCFQFSA